MKETRSDAIGGKMSAFVLVVCIAALAACNPAPTPSPTPIIEPTPCPEVVAPDCPQVSCPECPQVKEAELIGVSIPYYQELWSTSKHAETVPCESCHSGETVEVSRIAFASGLEVHVSGGDLACLQCHQRESMTTSIHELITTLEINDDDQNFDYLAFETPFPSTAASTLFGTWAMAGYQYDGKSYDARFSHTDSYDNCAECHDPHTLELKLDGCINCHQGVDARDDLDRIRGEVSLYDFDGDGNLQEGIAREIEGLQQELLQAMQAYTGDTLGVPIVYDPETAPYFFKDLNQNREPDADELNKPNAYDSWTARMLKAAHNYHFSMVDPGAYIHNGKYIIQLLYDSIKDLDSTRVEGLTRDDAGHFNGSAAAWRQWDPSGEVPRDCARCHTANGLPVYLTTGRDYPQGVSNGMQCNTCHMDPKRYLRYYALPVKFPSEVVLELNPDNNLCLNCHLGLAASTLLEAQLEGIEPDQQVEGLTLPDVHHLPAGATLFGSQAAGAYQYPQKIYASRNEHVFEFSTCTNCHSGHSAEVDEEQCATCHGHRAGSERFKPQHHPSPMGCRDCHGMVEVETIRGHKDYTIPVDHDGDGDKQEGLSQEVATMQATLFKAIQTYARDVTGNPIVYDPHGPDCYYFNDNNQNGELDASEVDPENCFESWTPRLLRAAYNHHFATMDPGAYAHNGDYILQVLYDSLADIGGDTSGMIRP